MARVSLILLLLSTSPFLWACGRPGDDESTPAAGENLPAAAEPVAPAAGTEPASEDIFSATVAVGTGKVALGGTQYEMTAKFSDVTRILTMGGGSPRENNMITMTLGVPVGYGPGTYNNDRERYSEGKYMMIQANRLPGALRHDPEHIFKVDIAADGTDYVITFEGGFLQGDDPVPCKGKVRLPQAAFAE